MDSVRISQSENRLTVSRYGTVTRPKRGRNSVSVALATAVHTPDGKTIFQKEVYRNSRIEQKRVKRDRDLARLMNCKTVDKFDYVPKKEQQNRPQMPKPTPVVCPKLKRDSVQALVMAGAEIYVDPWKHERQVIYNSYIKGHCGFDDIAALVRDGLIEKIPLPNGFFKYTKV